MHKNHEQTQQEYKDCPSPEPSPDPCYDCLVKMHHIPCRKEIEDEGQPQHRKSCLEERAHTSSLVYDIAYAYRARCSALHISHSFASKK